MSEFQSQNSCIPVKQLQVAQYTIESIVGDTRLPEIVVDMLTVAWNEYMIHIIVGKGQHSKEWIDAEDLIKLLLWSLKPKKEGIERKCLINKTHELMTGLKQGLEFVDYGPYKTALLFEMLKEIHLDILETGFWQNKRNSNLQLVGTFDNDISSNQSLCDVIEIAHCANNAESELSENSDVNKENDDAKSLNNTLITETKISDEKETIMREIELPTQGNKPRKASEVSTLKIGTWVEIRSGESVFKCKISRKETEQQTFVFVNRHGVKISEKTFSDFESDLENGNIKILDDAFLFENALSSLIGNSRSYDKH